MLSQQDLPKVRGQYRFNYPISKTSWFRTGGPAEVLFKPEDKNDLIDFLKNKPQSLNVTTLGVCSNVIVRKGGIKGVLIKLGRGFSDIKITDSKNNLISAGAGALDVNVAKLAAENSISGLEFLIGIPGTVGGAVSMNAGAYESQISDILTSATAIDLNGNIRELQNKDFGFKYRRHCLDEELIFTEVTLQGNKGDSKEITRKMQQISAMRETTQPVRARTGGSTFKNPENSDKKAWQLIDEAGCRGLRIGQVKVSEKHCNFLINEGSENSEDIEKLGEEVKKRVKEHSGIELNWEIKRIGED